MKILILARNKDICSVYKKMVLNSYPISSIFYCTSAEDAIFLILNQHIELVISEDQLPGRSGLELASTIYESKIPSSFIIISENDGSALNVIKAHVLGFLTKPVRPEKFETVLKETVQKVQSDYLRQEAKKNQVQKLKIATGNGFAIVDINRLVYCQADGSYTKIFLSDKSKHLSSYNIGRIEEKLANYQFIRINRSTLINSRYLNRVDRFQYECFVTIDQEELKLNVSKNYINLLE